MISENSKTNAVYSSLETEPSEERFNPRLPEFPRLGKSVAILIDYENVGFNNAWSVVDRIAETEHVGIVRAYANWNLLSKARKKFEAHGIIPTMVPTNRFGKNVADMQLATDALSIAYEKPAIRKIAIVSGDGDFSAVIRQIRSLGRCVWGYGPVDCSNDVLKKVCDEFFVFKYESTNCTGQLSKKKKAKESIPPTSPPSKVKPLSRSFLEKAAWALQVCYEAQALSANRNDVNNSVESLRAFDGTINADCFFQSLRQAYRDFEIQNWVSIKKRRRFHLLSAFQSEELLYFYLCPEIKNYRVGSGSKLESFLSNSSRPCEFEQLVKKQAFNFLKEKHHLPIS